MSILLFALLSMCNGLELIGEATPLDGNELIYTEHHSITQDQNGSNKLIETIYKKPDGSIFAKMTTNFSKNEFVPDILFEDLRFKTKDELIHNTDKKSLTIRRTDKSGNTQEKEIPVLPNMIAGQGFDNFLKRNFDTLNNGEMPINFVVLPKMDYYRFEAFSVNPRPQNKGFGLKVKNFFLSMFVDKIFVEYDPESKRLLTYKGLSNLDTDKGESQNIFIKYKVKQL